MVCQLRSATCQRCGSGFVLTATYEDLLDRRGIKVATPLLCPTCFLTKGPMPKKRGEVKWFNPRKRFGFIVSEDGEELFFHASSSQRMTGIPGRARQFDSTFTTRSRGRKR
jgi:hypothetical protein